MTDNTFTRMDLAQFDGHTPGPWRVECTSQRGHTVWAACGATGSMQIAACGYAVFDRHNAALIAAAPDLLAALRAAYAEIDRLQSQVIAVQEDAMTIYGDNDRLTAEIDRLRAQVADSDESGEENDNMKAEIDRLRAALEWVTVTEDPSSMPTLGTRVLVCPHGTSDAPRIMWRYTYHMWTSARDYSNWVQITPGDRWAYIPEAQA